MHARYYFCYYDASVKQLFAPILYLFSVRVFPMSTNTDNTARLIDPQAVVSIKVSTGYYQRLQRTLFFLMNNKSKQELEEAKRMVETNTCPEGSWQEQYFTLLIFCKAFEQQIEEQKLFRVATEKELQELASSL